MPRSRSTHGCRHTFRPWRSERMRPHPPCRQQPHDAGGQEHNDEQADRSYCVAGRSPGRTSVVSRRGNRGSAGAVVGRSSPGWSARCHVFADRCGSRGSCLTDNSMECLVCDDLIGPAARPARAGAGTWICSRRGRAQMLSWRCPGVTRIANGRPLPSQARWILVVSPPRDRPGA